METDVATLVQTAEFSPDDITARTREIYDTLLRESRYLDAGNFTCVHPDDVERMFHLYDGLFFGGAVRKLLGATPLYFRLSRRMTSAGGQTKRSRTRDASGTVIRTEYEIAVSTTLLFQTFEEDHRPVVMSGIECRDRLEALQRIVEHELTHLVEMLIWWESSCSAPRFQSIVRRFFAHTDARHQLITPREHAFTRFGIKAGDRVSFEMDGKTYVGIVNRITRRATVLVEDPAGLRYSDGKHYAKFYVPVNMLTPVGE
jgi:hypothetical protein